MNLGLSGKTALVTGASRGIGLSIAESLHSQGCLVAINSRNSEDLRGISSRLPGVIGISGDLTQPLHAKRVVSECLDSFGKLDILVCNIGSGSSVNPLEETYDEWQRVFALNLWSTTNSIEAAKDALFESRGCIICISSICGSEVIPNAPVTYSTAKAAIHAYVRGIARPLGKKGVRINAVAPGNIIFEGSVWSNKFSLDRKSVQAMLDQQVSLGCFGRPSDVANLVLYLASPLSHFATGQIWTIDGGQTRSN